MRDGVNPVATISSSTPDERDKRKRRTHPDEIQNGRPPFRRTHVSVVPDAARVEHGDETKAEAQCALGTEFAGVRKLELSSGAHAEGDDGGCEEER